MIVQFGGQTPLNLALPLKAAGVPIIGTSPESIDLAEDRKRFGKLLEELEIPQAPGAMATSASKKRSQGAKRIGYPGAGAAFLCARRTRHGDRLRRGDRRPLHERGGRVFAGPAGADRSLPRRRDRSRRGRALATAKMWSSAASCSTSKRPASTPAIRRACCRRSIFREHLLERMREYTFKLARALKVIGLMNIQFAIPRAMRNRQRSRAARCTCSK